MLPAMCRDLLLTLRRPCRCTRSFCCFCCCWCSRCRLLPSSLATSLADSSRMLGSRGSCLLFLACRLLAKEGVGERPSLPMASTTKAWPTAAKTVIGCALSCAWRRRGGIVGEEGGRSMMSDVTHVHRGREHRQQPRCRKCSVLHHSECNCSLSIAISSTCLNAKSRDPSEKVSLYSVTWGAWCIAMWWRVVVCDHGDHMAAVLGRMCE